MPISGHAMILALRSAGTLAETGPESIGYVIIAIGLVGLGLSLGMLLVVTRRRQHRR